MSEPKIPHGFVMIYTETHSKRQPLEDLGLSPDLIPRRGMRGQPRKIRHTDEQIVQLVYKQQLQGGRPFTNAAGADNNPCFTGVADFHGVHVSAVRAAWERVPAQSKPWRTSLLATASQ